MNKTKIVATVGPATYSREMLSKLVREGVSVFRINFSHGSHSDYAEVIRSIREINLEGGYHTAILGDLQGPKLRIGNMGEGVELITGERVVITNKEEVGTKDRMFVNYELIAKDLNPGDKVLINDGKVCLSVLSSNGKDEVIANIEQGGFLTSNKGVNLPNTGVSLPSLTQKDIADLNFAIEQGLEWIALSFVRSSKDIVDLKNKISEKNGFAKVIAKIEKPQALDDMENIIDVTDAIMVARGDLGVEVPLQYLPLIQKELVTRARIHSKPVIIATQMMDSMIESITPSRAEVNDVANAVMDGTDAVMLSAETSIGKYPLEVIQTMHKIIENAETYDGIYHKDDVLDPTEGRTISDAICQNASKLARDSNATAIVTMSFSGYTGFKVSSYRPKANTFVFTANRNILNMLNLLWGVRGYYYNKFISTDDTINDIMENLKNQGMVSEGDLIINIASMPIKGKGKSNMLKLSEVS